MSQQKKPFDLDEAIASLSLMRTFEVLESTPSVHAPENAALVDAVMVVV
jgi:hypothetical protein